MAKVEIKRSHKPKDTAAKLEGKLLQEQEILEFIDYVQHGYEHDVATNKQALYAYELNKIRDSCIITLILNSGLRVSEIFNLNIDDIDLKKKLTHVYRKGTNDDNFKTPVYFRQDAIQAQDVRGHGIGVVGTERSAAPNLRQDDHTI